MFPAKYVGLNVHQATTSPAVVMESVLETKAATILAFIDGLRGDISVTFEEGTWATWLYDLLKPPVAKLVVCDSRRNALLKSGNKSDKIDARKLADPYKRKNGIGGSSASLWLDRVLGDCEFFNGPRSRSEVSSTN